jgi:hypothetical protein
MDKRVIVNYSRVALGQEGASHISPLAAYDAESDSFLVLASRVTSTRRPG